MYKFKKIDNTYLINQETFFNNENEKNNELNNNNEILNFYFKKKKKFKFLIIQILMKFMMYIIKYFE